MFNRALQISIAFLATFLHAASPDSTRVKWATQQLDRYAEEAMARTHVPGMAIVVVQKGEVAFVRGYGVRDTTKPERVDADTVFQLATLSRPITSTVLASLATGGYLHWDDAIAHLDPGFKLSDEYVTQSLTIRDLLTHRSGLPARAGSVLQDLGYGETEILARLQLLGPLSDFRYGINDTGAGFTEAAHAAAGEYGDSWQDILRSRVLLPLGMYSTHALHKDFLKAPNRAELHYFDGTSYLRKFERSEDGQAPADGVSSSANDLAKWLGMLVNRGISNTGEIVAAEVLEETFSPQMLQRVNSETGTIEFAGLGWDTRYEETGRKRVSYSGAFHLGAANAVALIPKDQIGIVVLTNGSPMGLPEAMVETFFDLLYAGTPGKPLTQDWLQTVGDSFGSTQINPLVQDWLNKTRPPFETPTDLPMTAYEGTYYSAYYGDLTVSLTPGSTLKLALGKDQKLVYDLSHRDRNVFTFKIEMESGVGTTAASFSVSDGRVTQLIIDNFTQDGDGTFQRAKLETAP